MVWTPVFRGTPPKPLWIQRGSIWQPAWSEDPCSEECCTVQPTCEECFQQVIDSGAIGMRITGFPTYSCNNGTTECCSTTGVENDTWTLTYEGSNYFSTILGTLADCGDRGLLAATAGCGNFASGFGCDDGISYGVFKTYLYKIRVDTPCTGSELGFINSKMYYHTFCWVEGSSYCDLHSSNEMSFVDTYIPLSTELCGGAETDEVDGPGDGVGYFHCTCVSQTLGIDGKAFYSLLL